MPDRIPNPDVLVGCDAMIEINGIKVAYAKNLDFEENLNQRPVHAIGSWRPRGHKSVMWEGRLSMELHVLTEDGDGILHIDTSNPVVASQPYEVTIYKESTTTLVASALGQIDSRSWQLLTNDMTGQRVSMVLQIIEDYTGYN